MIDTIKWLDDFTNYVVPSNEQNNINEWFTNSYVVNGIIVGSGAASFSVRTVSTPGFASRTCLWGYGRSSSQIRPLICSLPFQRLGVDTPTGNVYMGMRVINLPSSTNNTYSAQMGVIKRRPNSTIVDVLFGINIISRSVIRVSYCDEYGIKQRLDVELPYPFAGSHDVMEMIFSKPVDDDATSHLGQLTVWINNKVAFSRAVVNQVGKLDEFNIVPMGMIDVLSTNSAPPGYVSSFNLTTDLPGPGLGYGITDLVISTTSVDVVPTRYGKVRVSSRTATLDATPNDFSFSPGADGSETHAAVVSTKEYDTSKYLIGPNIDSTEMFAGPQFPDLGSQSVLGVAIKSVGSKLDPNGFDLANAIRLGNDITLAEPAALLSTPTMTFSAMSKNPISGLSWRASEVNASQFGVRVAVKEE